LASKPDKQPGNAKKLPNMRSFWRIVDRNHSLRIRVMAGSSCLRWRERELWPAIVEFVTAPESLRDIGMLQALPEHPASGSPRERGPLCREILGNGVHQTTCSIFVPTRPIRRSPRSRRFCASMNPTPTWNSGYQYYLKVASRDWQSSSPRCQKSQASQLDRCARSGNCRLAQESSANRAASGATYSHCQKIPPLEHLVCLATRALNGKYPMVVHHGNRRSAQEPASECRRLPQNVQRRATGY